ncbi:MAG: nicotinate phosphoribosyltransferase [Planctomycetia bacterium]|nr:nicotinate phosphoribosyltransferase [Planctomycetia bacterium]
MKPTSPFVGPLLTDLYELTMAYAYWKSGRQDDPAVFDLFFRRNPFGGEFTIFGGLEEVVRFISDFRFTDEQIEHVREIMPDCESEFFPWLRTLNCSAVKVHAVAEGTVVFPRVPLITVEGPVAVAQLLESAVLNLVGFASLIMTSAMRLRLAAGKDKELVEFGLRRAQGPDGAISASRYSFLGGFDATSNVLASEMFGIPVKGTLAHSFVSCFLGLEDLRDKTLTDPENRERDFLDIVLQCREELRFTETHEGELAAFVAYAQAFPNSFLALVDTYDTLRSGVPNFLTVALALHRIGYKAVGIRLDSGDLAYLSKETRRMFRDVGERMSVDFAALAILASNVINQGTLLSLDQQGHEIDAFGIGTHLVTCQSQPALGCVYKLVEINGSPRIKLSENIGKMTIPGRKRPYRLIGESGYPEADLIVYDEEGPPQAGRQILCRHPFDELKQVRITARDVIPLHDCVWDCGVAGPLPSMAEVRSHTLQQIAAMRSDHLRFLNPTPYKVSVSERLQKMIHTFRLREAPAGAEGPS